MIPDIQLLSVSCNVVLHLKPSGTIDLLSFDKIPCCSNKKLHGGTLISKHKSICFEAKVWNIRYGGNRKVYPPPTPTRPLGITRPLPDITPTRLRPTSGLLLLRSRLFFLSPAPHPSNARGRTEYAMTMN